MTMALTDLGMDSNLMGPSLRGGRMFPQDGDGGSGSGVCSQSMGLVFSAAMSVEASSFELRK